LCTDPNVPAPLRSREKTKSRFPSVEGERLLYREEKSCAGLPLRTAGLPLAHPLP
jgi:hypothetical protein